MAEYHSAAEFHSAVPCGAQYGRLAACGRLGIGPLRQTGSRKCAGAIPSRAASQRFRLILQVVLTLRFLHKPTSGQSRRLKMMSGTRASRADQGSAPPERYSTRSSTTPCAGTIVVYSVA